MCVESLAPGWWWYLGKGREDTEFCSKTLSDNDNALVLSVSWNRSRNFSDLGLEAWINCSPSAQRLAERGCDVPEQVSILSCQLQPVTVTAMLRHAAAVHKSFIKRYSAANDAHRKLIYTLGCDILTLLPRPTTSRSDFDLHIKGRDVRHAPEIRERHCLRQKDLRGTRPRSTRKRIHSTLRDLVPHKSSSRGIR